MEVKLHNRRQIKDAIGALRKWKIKVGKVILF